LLFADAGFEVLGFNKFPTAQGIYLLGSGAWGVKDIIAAENDLGVPVVHPVAARVWYVQKLLRVKNPLKGASRLLEELPLESLTVPDLSGKP
jgi:maleate cis-trans isomerase